MIQRINPPGLHQTPGYHHVTVADVNKMVFLFAGQCPLDEWGQLVGTGDLRIQVEQVIRNIVTALSDASRLLTMWFARSSTSSRPTSMIFPSCGPFCGNRSSLPR